MIFACAAFLSALLLLAAGLPAGAQGAWAAVISFVGSAGDIIGKLLTASRRRSMTGMQSQMRPTFIRFKLRCSGWNTQSLR